MVKHISGVAKRNHEIRVAKVANRNHKGFFKMYGTKDRERIGPLTINTGEFVENYENMSKMLNDYFLPVFTQEDGTTIPERVQIYEVGDGDKLRDIIITGR